MLHRKILNIFLILLTITIYSSKAISGLWDYTIYIEQQTTDFQSVRINAINNNRKLALENVISKLINISDFNIVNKLIDSDTAYFFEEKLRLLNESTSNNLYKVSITYYFNKNKIFAFLNKNSIPYITNLKNKVLVVPITGHSLTTSTNWYKLFSSLHSDDYLTEIILLNNNVNKVKLLQKDRNYLLELKNIYEVDDVVVADLYTTFMDRDSESKSVVELDSITLEERYTLDITSLSNGNYQLFDSLSNLYEALKYVIGYSELNIKNNIAYNQEVKNTKIFKVVYNSFIDWVAIYNYLKQIPQVDSVYLSELNEYYCIIKIKYHGLLDDIVKVALNRNIIIDTDELSISCKGFCY